MDHDLSAYSIRKMDIAFPIDLGAQLFPHLVAELHLIIFQQILMYWSLFCLQGV